MKIPGFRPGKAPRRLLEARLGTEVGARPGAARLAARVLRRGGRRRGHRRDRAARDRHHRRRGRRATSSSTPSSRCGRVVTVEGHDTLPRRDRRARGRRRRRSTRRSTRCATASPTSRTATAPLTDGDYAEIDIKGYVDDESVEGLTATDYLYEVGSGIVVPKLDEELHGKRPGDILKFNDELPERFGERAGDEVVVPGAREGRQEEGAPRAHRRVGERGQRVRHRRRAARRRPHPPRPRTRACRRQMAMRDKVFEAAAGARRPTRCPTTLVDQRDGATPPRSRAPARGAGPAHDDPAVPGRDGPGPAGVRRRRAGRCRRGRARRPRAARGGRPGGDRGDRRRGRRRDRTPRRADWTRSRPRSARISNGGA